MTTFNSYRTFLIEHHRLIITTRGARTDFGTLRTLYFPVMKIVVLRTKSVIPLIELNWPIHPIGPNGWANAVYSKHWNIANEAYSTVCFRQFCPKKLDKTHRQLTIFLTNRDWLTLVLKNIMLTNDQLIVFVLAIVSAMMHAADGVIGKVWETIKDLFIWLTHTPTFWYSQRRQLQKDTNVPRGDNA